MKLSLGPKLQTDQISVIKGDIQKPAAQTSIILAVIYHASQIMWRRERHLGLKVFSKLHAYHAKLNELLFPAPITPPPGHFICRYANAPGWTLLSLSLPEHSLAQLSQHNLFTDVRTPFVYSIPSCYHYLER